MTGEHVRVAQVQGKIPAGHRSLLGGRLLAVRPDLVTDD